ncbi:MAG TPA: tRNA guanosine(34) transglycosylase Tgt [Chloroflexota bacterium]|nr:tRNA guanosine(34) transglycosylase Tgt [Chloroflexota bacterium]
MPISFTVAHELADTAARVGRIETAHGAVDTPAFFPVGTQATVKTLTPGDLIALGAPAILANTYHLFLRPGPELIERLGGLHRFMAWPRVLMTDSGGFQAFSLGMALEHGVGKIANIFPGSAAAPTQPVKKKLAKVTETGVEFASHLNGARLLLTPELSIRIQQQLGADLVVAFDECTSPLSSYEYTREALARTHRWEERSLDAWSAGRPGQGLYGIVQGGYYRDLRDESARFVAALPFDAIAIGGSLGRSKRDMLEILEWVIPILPREKPRHLLGIGEPEDLFACVERGIDTFDCVGPTRLARHGSLYTPNGRLNIKNAVHSAETGPIEEGCGCYTCRTFDRAYLRHLFAAEEILGYRLATIHNLHFILSLMARIRQSIADETFFAFKQGFLARYRGREAA